MWSDVRGRLLTLRPLSVLSLREWALQENAHNLITEFGGAETRQNSKKKNGVPDKGGSSTPAPTHPLSVGSWFGALILTSRGGTSICVFLSWSNPPVTWFLPADSYSAQAHTSFPHPNVPSKNLPGLIGSLTCGGICGGRPCCCLIRSFSCLCCSDKPRMLGFIFWAATYKSHHRDLWMI